MRKSCYLDNKDLIFLKEITLRGEITAKDAEQIYELSAEATWRRLSRLVKSGNICRKRHGMRFYYALNEQSETFEERIARLFNILILAIKQNQLEMEKLKSLISKLEQDILE